MLIVKVKDFLFDNDRVIIYQDNDYFKFSVDSVLLANFVSINLRDRKIMDLACGNAPIPMLLTFKTKALIYGVELQKEIYDLAVESVKENKMDKQIHLICDDVKNIYDKFDSDMFDIVTCNPPYFKENGKMINSNMVKCLARHEVSLNLEDILKVSKKILKNGGKLSIVHSSNRLIEIITLFKKYNIEPKKLQFVYPKSGKDSHIILIEGVKNGRPGLKVLSPLIIYDKDGNYNKDILKMFKG